MEDKYQHLSEYRPYWRHVDEFPPPKNLKCLWKNDYGAAVIGIWYQGCGWTYWSPLPSHHPKDKNRRRNSWEHPEKTITA